jgi:hypothetical protein
MMFGRKKIRALEKDIENLCDIIEAKEADIYTLVMEPDSVKATEVRILYKMYHDAMKQMWAGSAVELERHSFYDQVGLKKQE